MTEDLLRTHVARGAYDKARSGERGIGEVPLLIRLLRMHLGQSEVQNLQLPPRRDHDVGWLEVAVNDAVLVRFGHRIGRLQSEVQHASEIQRSSANRRR